jgi:hypothetical protein
MRLALIATAVAAAIAVPLAVQAAGPQMSRDEFVSAVRCTAYETALAPRADLAAARMRLNAEAQRQPADAVARAHNEVNSVNAEFRAVANPADAAMMRAGQASACSTANVAQGVSGHDAA